jgi:hypothetical protein
MPLRAISLDAPQTIDSHSGTLLVPITYAEQEGADETAIANQQPLARVKCRQRSTGRRAASSSGTRRA